MYEELKFTPFPGLKNPHLQTIVGSYLTVYKSPISKTRLIDLSDGDKLAIEISTPSNWKPTDRTLMLHHGLCGSHDSVYMVRLARKFYDLGFQVVRVNLRGCGSGKNLARQVYHHGKTEDIFEAIKFIKKSFPESRMTLIGFSLSGNLVLKLAGELAGIASRFFSDVISICPPIEINKTESFMKNSFNSIYQKYFIKHLKKDMDGRYQLFDYEQKISIPEKWTLEDFNRQFVVPFCGFENPDDFYIYGSAKQFIEHIEVPTKILFAKDDPIIYPNSLDDIQLPINVKIYKTQHGGHVGFLGKPSKNRGFFWMDDQLMDWVGVKS